MHVLQNLPLDYLGRKRELIANAAVVVTDPCMKAERFECVLSYCRPGQIVCVDPVSTAYARALIPYIGQIHTVKPNRLELEILAGQPVDTDARLESACETLLNRGVQRVFVSLGAEGCFYMDAAGRPFPAEAPPCDQHGQRLRRGRRLHRRDALRDDARHDARGNSRLRTGRRDRGHLPP